jgi:hypothetical protein
MTENKSMHDVISVLLTEKLKRFSSKETEIKLTPGICIEIYTEIFGTFVEVLQESKINISNESMNYLAQCYYDGILINNQHELNPNIFDQRAKLENIETKELALLTMMVRGTDFAIPLIKEIKRRS